MRRVVREGQNPRPLQEKATSISSPHELQRTRAKPLARMPQARYPLELMTTKPGRPAPSPRCSISARKVFRWARTVSCSTVRSGSRRRYLGLIAAPDDAEPVHAPSLIPPIRRRRDHEPGQSSFEAAALSNGTPQRPNEPQGVSFWPDPAHSGHAGRRESGRWLPPPARNVAPPSLREVPRSTLNQLARGHRCAPRSASVADRLRTS